MSLVVVSELEHVAYVKLHRPEVRNAFNPQMISELTEIFKELDKNKSLRAIALQGEGKAFCAGGDLNWMKEMVNYTFEQNQNDAKKLFEMFESIYNCSLPVIGLIHGAAFGGALGLIACCDYVISEESTQFSFSEVKLGIAPAVISSFVAKKTNLGKVKPYMLSGAVFFNKEAVQLGLVNETTLNGEGHHVLARVLHAFKECGPEAVRETKKWLNQLPNCSWVEQKESTTKLIAERRASPEGQEGLKSFLEKRSPAWKL